MSREAKDYEECQAIKATQLKTGTRSIAWIESDECLYRGRAIRRHDDVPTGYGGRYSVRYSGGKRASFSRMSEAKQFIDTLIAEAELAASVVPQYAQATAA